MEDLFQIIFIVIFILSTIISSMKKKKKQRQKGTTLSKSPSQSKARPVSNKKQKSSAELLEEMLGLKIQLPEPQKREAPVYSEVSEDSTWDPSEDFEEKKRTPLSNYREKTSAKKSEFIEDKQKHRAFKEKDIKPKRVKKPTYAQKLFTTQSNLKDYIIVQEILNKPKALRR